MKPWLRRLVCRWFDLVPSEFCAEYGDKMWEGAREFAVCQLRELRDSYPRPGGPIGEGVSETFERCLRELEGTKYESMPVTKYFSPEVRVSEQERWKEAHR